jgi:hypothetical protein
MIKYACINYTISKVTSNEIGTKLLKFRYINKFILKIDIFLFDFDIT